MPNGEPCIRGLPITVGEFTSRVLKAIPLEQILAEYPPLTLVSEMGMSEMGIDNLNRRA